MLTVRMTLKIIDNLEQMIAKGIGVEENTKYLDYYKKELKALEED